jgi:hypothetical protein
LSATARVPSAYFSGRGPRLELIISCVVFDPLDGSSNIDAGVNVGTIFGIYKVVRGIFLPSMNALTI